MMNTTYERLRSRSRLDIPAGWQCIRTIDMHTGGEPLRIIVDGFPPPDGRNVLAYRRYLAAQHDSLRKALMHEPRGHADMYGCILLPPNDEEADFGIVFLHNEGYSTMCGHAIIAVATLAVQLQWVEVELPETTLLIDAPCGRIKAFVTVEDQQVQKVRFLGVPSFVLAMNQQIAVPGLGKLNYDIAYGGAFYAYVQAEQLNLALVPENYNRIIHDGMAIKRAVVAQGIATEHPFEPDLSFLYGTIFIGGPISPGVDSRNVCVFAEGEVDRCPTGSGVSGRMPLHFARKEIGIGDKIRIESITGSVFTGSVVQEATYGPYKAVIPEVEGSAFITGTHQFVIDPNDPFQEGFFLR
ncbi:MAG: proline racemase family protein [Bacteroidota bacterium]